MQHPRRSARIIQLSLVLPFFVATGACDQESQGVPLEAEGRVDSRSEAAPEDPAPHARHGRHPGRHARGPAARLCARVECTPDQRARIDALANDLREDHRKSDPAVHRVQANALAEAFRAETLDPAVLTRIHAQREEQRTAHESAMESFFVGVHGVLSPEQRETLAQVVETRGMRGLARRGHDKRGHGKRGHGRRSHGKRGGHGRHGDATHRDPEAKLDRLCDRLDCGPEQREALTDLATQAATARPDPGAFESVNRELADAIRGDRLTAQQLRHYRAAVRQIAGKDIDRMSTLIVRFHAILTPEQRQALASRIESDGRLPRFPFGPFGPFGHGPGPEHLDGTVPSDD